MNKNCFKKIISGLLAGAIALTLYGCGNKEAEVSTDNFGSEAENFQDVNTQQGNIPQKENSEQQENSVSMENSDSESELVLLTPYLDYTELRICCSTEDGFYFMDGWIDSAFPHLKYVDYATKQVVYLCSDSSCKHDKESCTAVFPYKEFYTEFAASQLFVYHDKLFFLSAASADTIVTAGSAIQPVDGTEEGFVSVGSIERGKNSALYQMNLDGTGREKILELKSGQTAESPVVGEGDNLWFIIKTPDIYKDEETGATLACAKDRNLVKFSLSQRKIIDSIPIDDYNNISLDFLGVGAGKILFNGIEYPDGKSRLDYAEILAPADTMEEELARWDETKTFFDKCNQVFFSLDTSTKEIKEIYRQKGFFSDVHQYKDSLFINGRDYVDGGAYTVTRVDAATGKHEDFKVPDGYILWGFFGDKIVYIHQTEDWSDDNYYFCDFNSDVLTKVKPIVNLNTEVMAIFGDKALVTKGGEHLFDFENLYLISLEDIYSGTESFEPITAA